MAPDSYVYALRLAAVKPRTAVGSSRLAVLRVCTMFHDSVVSLHVDATLAAVSSQKRDALGTRTAPPARVFGHPVPYQWLSFTKPIRNSDLAQPVPTSCVTNDSDVKLAVDAELPGLCVEQAAQSPVRLSTTCCDR